LHYITMLTKLEEKTTLPPALSGAQINTESASLCSYYTQVTRIKYNSHYVKELCKLLQDFIDW
jgi:hypothetical protein